jgi:hypothetical protein
MESGLQTALGVCSTHGTHGLDTRMEGCCNLSIVLPSRGEQQHMGTLEFTSATIAFVDQAE